jgi:hypothetical protein
VRTRRYLARTLRNVKIGLVLVPIAAGALAASVIITRLGPTAKSDAKPLVRVDVTAVNSPHPALGLRHLKRKVRSIRSSRAWPAQRLRS